MKRKIGFRSHKLSRAVACPHGAANTVSMKINSRRFIAFLKPSVALGRGAHLRGTAWALGDAVLWYRNRMMRIHIFSYVSPAQ